MNGAHTDPNHETVAETTVEEQHDAPPPALSEKFSYVEMSRLALSEGPLTVPELVARIGCADNTGYNILKRLGAVVVDQVPGAGLGRNLVNRWALPETPPRHRKKTRPVQTNHVSAHTRTAFLQALRGRKKPVTYKQLAKILGRSVKLVYHAAHQLGDQIEIVGHIGREQLIQLREKPAFRVAALDTPPKPTEAAPALASAAAAPLPTSRRALVEELTQVLETHLRVTAELEGLTGRKAALMAALSEE